MGHYGLMPKNAPIGTVAKKTSKSIVCLEYCIFVRINFLIMDTKLTEAIAKIATLADQKKLQLILFLVFLA